MKSKFLLLVGMLFAAGAVMTGCKDDPNPDPRPDTLTKFSADEATGDKAVTSAGGTRTIAFSSPVDWTASVVTSDGGDWATITPTSGPVGTSSVTLTAKKNESTTDARSATVTIKAGTESLTYVVEQRNAIKFKASNTSSNVIYIPTEGEDFVVQLENNAGTVGYTVSLSEADAKWITYNKPSKATVTDQLSFTIKSDATFDFGTIRTGSIVITENLGGPEKVTITVKQAGDQTFIAWFDGVKTADQVLAGLDPSKHITVYVAGTGADANAIFAAGSKVANKIATVNMADAVATSIPQNAFQGKSSLKQVVINTKITSIESGAFDGTSLSSITFPLVPTSVTVDGAKKSVDFPNPITAIGDNAFSGTKLSAVELPGSLKTLGASAFEGCSALKTVTFAYSGWKANDKYDTKLTNAVESIGNKAFMTCLSLSSVTLPDKASLVSLGDDVFNGDYALVGAFALPETVTSIGARAFMEVPMSSITLTAVKTLGDNVFDGCSSLASITSKTATPPTVATTLGLMKNQNLVIKVPAANVADYQGATGWSAYSAKISK